jgi:glycosyltransferase involved in cell wall biosynthesis
MKEPLLSVCLITYNHINYIRQAIDGVLIQKVNFTWELIIADDFSTDGTRDIVLEYKEKYPDFIKLILQEKNVGAAKNWTELISSPKSKYIAYFEGDDYWTDPYKLQKQIDFLETNVDYSFCFHPTLNLDAESKIFNKTELFPNETYSIEDLITNIYIRTGSIVYRNINQSELVDFISKFQVGDYPLFFFLAKHGKIGYIKDYMSVYRIHSNGIWNKMTLKNQYLKSIQLFESLLIYFCEPEYQKVKDNLESLIDNHIRELIKTLTEHGEFDLLKKLLIKYYSKDLSDFVISELINDNQKQRKQYDAVINSGKYKFTNTIFKPYTFLRNRLKQ